MRFLIIILVLISSFSYSQKVEIGEIKTITSKILNEEREYLVYFPKHYNDKNYPQQQYPVIYLLDGEKYFHLVSGMLNNLSDGYYPQMPECILIAIKNTNRSRDLTPTKDVHQQYESGGGEKFREFISTELMPEITTNYRTLDYKILIGHSFGGLFVMNALFKNHNLFNAYIAIDPSLWWNDYLFVKQSDSILKNTDFNNRKLFFINANSLEKLKDPSKQHTNHFEAKLEFLKIIKKNRPINLNFSTNFYNNEDHGSVVLPSLIDGFRTIFKGFRLNAKEVVIDPSLIQTNYQRISKILGFSLKPQSFYLDNLVELAEKMGEKENAVILRNFK